MRVGLGWIRPEKQDEEKAFTFSVCLHCHLAIILPDDFFPEGLVSHLLYLDQHHHCCDCPDHSYPGISTDINAKGVSNLTSTPSTVISVSKETSE